MKIKLLSKNAKVPTCATASSAGYDLYVPEDTIIFPGRNIVPLDISLEIPVGIEGQIRPRSGFSAKGMEGFKLEIKEYAVHIDKEPMRFDADVIIGTIDSDYRGCVGVLIKSFENMPFMIKKSTRIAQIVFASHWSGEFSVVNELEHTDRSEGGFGHSGTK